MIWSSLRNDELSLRLPSIICAREQALFWTSVKALSDDQAVHGANSSLGSFPDLKHLRQTRCGQDVCSDRLDHLEISLRSWQLATLHRRISLSVRSRIEETCDSMR